jgi:hypothetical protein
VAFLDCCLAGKPFRGQDRAGRLSETRACCQWSLGPAVGCLRLPSLGFQDNSVSVHHYCFPCIKSVSWIHGKTSKTDRR